MGDIVNDVRSVLGTNYITAIGIDLDGSFTVTRDEISSALRFWTDYAERQRDLAGRRPNNPVIRQHAEEYTQLVERLRQLETRIPPGQGVAYVSPEFRHAFAHLEDRVQDILARADLMGDRDGVPTARELDTFAEGYEEHLRMRAAAAEIEKKPVQAQAFRRALTLLPERMRRAHEALKTPAAMGLRPFPLPR